MSRTGWDQRGYKCVRMSAGVCLGAGTPLPHRAWWSPQPLPQGIVEAYQNGDIVLGNTTSMGRWEIVGSFFFSVSTITTIGKSGVGLGKVGWEGWPPLRDRRPAAFGGVIETPVTPSVVRPGSMGTTREQNLGLPTDVLDLHSFRAAGGLWGCSGGFCLTQPFRKQRVLMQQ